MEITFGWKTTQAKHDIFRFFFDTRLALCGLMFAFHFQFHIVLTCFGLLWRDSPRHIDSNRNWHQMEDGWEWNPRIEQNFCFAFHEKFQGNQMVLLINYFTSSSVNGSIQFGTTRALFSVLFTLIIVLWTTSKEWTLQMYGRRIQQKYVYGFDACAYESNSPIPISFFLLILWLSIQSNSI